MRAPAPPPAGSGTADLAGTWTVARLVMRRDRILLPVWLLVLAAVAASSAAATVGIYPTAAERRAAAEAVNSAPALVALYGRIYDPSNLGGIAMLKMTAFGAVLVAVLMLLTVIRHTRGDEEEGRTELLRAGVVGRRAPLVAALILTLGASLLLGLLTALALVAAGLDARGAWAFGLSWACAGAAFAAVGAVAAQLTASARAARGVAVGVLAGSFVLRAVGDISSPAGPWWLSWLSPIGWSQQIRPFGGNRWWVALVPVAFTALAVAVAVALLDRRDLGAGLVQPRPGPSRAGRGLGTPLGLAWRLQRASFLAWLSGFVVLALVLGNMASRPRRPPGRPRCPGPDHPDGWGAGPHRRVPQHRARCRGRGRGGVRRAGGAAAARGGVGAARRAGAGHGRHPAGVVQPATCWWRWRPRPA